MSWLRSSRSHGACASSALRTRELRDMTITNMATVVYRN